MKILELRFKNLNSLYGEWFIDFTDPEYISNGIFALTGPTGAGKSTILDAMCLALYGETPRLGKITKSGNEIMSRQTGECYAEVLFESQEGRFRCHWAQHRARKKADGELQTPKHEIAEGRDEGKVIEHQIRRTAAVIEEKNGMDFDRFTRSILLAQGGFDTFLKAKEEQKSRILEQITGTEIYTEISKRVHERQREEREKLYLLKAETAGIVILEPEQEKEIKQELEDKQKQEQSLAAGATETGKAIAWLTGIEELRKEINDLSKEAGLLQIEDKAFKPERARLSRALKAAELEGKYANLTAIRKQQKADKSSLKSEESKLSELERFFKQQEKQLKDAERQTRKTKENLKQSAPLIQKVRFLDQKLAEKENAVKRVEANCKKDADTIEKDKKLKLKEQEKSDKAGTDLNIIELFLKEQSRDEWLVTGLAGIEEQLNSLVSKQKEIVQKENDTTKAKASHEKNRKTLESCTKRCGSEKKKLEAAVKSLEKVKKGLRELLGDRLLREYRGEKDALLREMAYIAKIAELAEHRVKLEDGKACPLCGSADHPFAKGNVPVPDETEKKILSLSSIIQKAEEQEVTIRKHETAERVARENLSKSEKHELAATKDEIAAEKNLSDLAKRLSADQLAYGGMKKTLLTKLEPRGITEIPDEDVSELLESLRSRLEKWQVAAKKKTEIEKRITEIDSEVKRLAAIIDTQNRSLGEKQEVLKADKKEYAAGIAERREMYGNKNPDTEEKRVNTAIVETEAVEKQARNTRDKAQQKLSVTKTTIASLKDQTRRRDTELNNLEAEFLTIRNSTGFTKENQFLEARLSIKERDTLSAKAKDIDERNTNLKARQKDREERLVKETVKKVTDKKLEELNPYFKELEENVRVYREALAGLKHKLTENTRAKERIKEKHTAIEAQQKECNRWDKLHGLIGSADGKKYRNFAQGLTFELMVSHANLQLEKMTERYLLIRDAEQPLELNVVDNYQAGEIRSTKNLSGGESFIVSLTLALGLSKMASRKVRVDSLFLDEGFGTLDEEALETALETLAGLQQEGKLIGIISHVSALKERISTQITINPVSGGKSMILGPGCRKLV